MNRIELNKIDSKAPKDADKEALKKELFSLHKKMFSLQHLFYANASKSMLIIFQGMDTSGKDGTIRHVFSCVNPLGVHASAFSEPCDKERVHDFLWRIYQQLPEKGMIRIFNRSHYEDILVPTVHRMLDDKLIERRYDYINSFEQQLEDSGTIILKFYLLISRDEQKKRLEKRLKDPLKKWKYKASDKTESKKWNDYIRTYENIISRCSPAIPWQVIPADDKWYRNYLVAKTIVGKLESLKMKYPGDEK
ncbi:polyphosphate kinase [Panacibacter ginsenosidivorans]|uniref:Polyphosphate kinase n=1 Tax=Panacibacter ginsenosidivorans TaxID=1813871 RepID=A0A5B8VHC0_9BACT|nr:PPK2 family polyphosphate kinase [Panacibacter ginsenosidivorans]QEC69708.1 polyphosphate kinase [Panacibacter ginsenosidivorans]